MLLLICISHRRSPRSSVPPRCRHVPRIAECIPYQKLFRAQLAVDRHHGIRTGVNRHRVGVDGHPTQCKPSEPKKYLYVAVLPCKHRVVLLVPYPARPARRSTRPSTLIVTLEGAPVPQCSRQRGGAWAVGHRIGSSGARRRVTLRLSAVMPVTRACSIIWAPAYPASVAPLRMVPSTVVTSQEDSVVSHNLAHIIRVD